MSESRREREKKRERTVGTEKESRRKRGRVHISEYAVQKLVIVQLHERPIAIFVQQRIISYSDLYASYLTSDKNCPPKYICRS